MALVRWRRQGDLSPWSALRDLEEQFNRVLTPLREGTDWTKGSWVPEIDLKETDEFYTIEADLPGMKKF